MGCLRTLDTRLPENVEAANEQHEVALLRCICRRLLAVQIAAYFIIAAGILATIIAVVLIILGVL